MTELGQESEELRLKQLHVCPSKPAVRKIIRGTESGGLSNAARVGEDII